MSALTIIYLLLPFYNDISGKQRTFALTEGAFWKVISSAIIGTLLMSSIYPALLLASFKPIKALKGKITASIGTAFLRKILIVFQFFIAIVLIIGTLVISMQRTFTFTWRKGNILYVRTTA